MDSVFLCSFQVCFHGKCWLYRLLPTAALTSKCHFLIKWDEYLKAGWMIVPCCPLSSSSVTSEYANSCQSALWGAEGVCLWDVVL